MAPLVVIGPCAMSLDCGLDIQIIMLTYNFLVHVLYSKNEDINMASARQYEIIKMIFLRAVVPVFKEETMTYILVHLPSVLPFHGIASKAWCKNKTRLQG